MPDSTTLQGILSQNPVEVTLFPETSRRTFSDLSSLVGFVEQEASFWNQFKGDTLGVIHRHFAATREYLRRAADEKDPSLMSVCLNLVRHSLTLNRFPCMFSATAEASYLNQLSQQGPGVADGYVSYTYSQDTQFSQRGDQQFVQGILLGFHTNRADQVHSLPDGGQILRCRVAYPLTNLQPPYGDWKDHVFPPSLVSIFGSKAAFDAASYNFFYLSSHMACLGPRSTVRILYGDNSYSFCRVVAHYELDCLMTEQPPFFYVREGDLLSFWISTPESPDYMEPFESILSQTPTDFLSIWQDYYAKRGDNETIASRRCEIRNRAGVHARPAAQLVQTAAKFRSKVYLAAYRRGVADVGDIMAMVVLGATYGQDLLLLARGTDALFAVEAVSTVIGHRFDEE